MPLVENLARKFATSQQASGVMAITDMIQEGHVNLIKAVDRIDWDRINTSEDPEKTSTRIAFLTTFVGGLLLYSSYSASLTSFLAIVQVAYPFVDLHSLDYQSDFKIGSVGGTVMDNYFAVSSGLLNFMYQSS